MSDGVFTHDVFLSHSSKDKAVVRPLAERLRADGLKVWLDEWVLKPEIPLAHRMGEGSGVRAAKIEEGLERSRVLVLCMSAAKQTALLPVRRPEQAARVAEAANTSESYRRTLLQ